MSSNETLRESSPPSPPARRTMPPPELLDRRAPASVGDLVLENLRAEMPVPRHSGPRADEAYLRARLAESRLTGDLAVEREASVALARLLAATRGRDLGLATKLARRALMLEEDLTLRTELAGWLAGLGECALAAATLRGLCDPTQPADTARTLVKIAVLLARADDAPGAVDALSEAAEIDPADATALEMLGGISTWSPSTITPIEAAVAYLQAADRREAAMDKEAAFEDRLRALEMAPENQDAAVATALTLVSQGRAGAADEVLRAHAVAVDAVLATDPLLPPEERLFQQEVIHRTRMLNALQDNDAARAVAAVLDAGFEGELGGEDQEKVDEVLSMAGLYELCAVRLEMRGDASTGAERGQVFTALARLYAGPLSSPDRAVEAWIEALSAEPGNTAARAALRDHAAALHDASPLIEALIRIGEGSIGEPAERVAALQELVTIAEEHGDPSLASWALDKVEASGGGADGVHAEKLRLMSRLRRQEDGLAAARRAYEGADTPEARVKALRRLLPFYQGQVDELSPYLDALVEIVMAAPTERAFLTALERVCSRTSDLTILERVLEERVGANLPRVELVRARLGISAIARRRGDDEKALAEVLPLLSEAPGHRGAACTALVLATKLARASMLSPPIDAEGTALPPNTRARERADALVQLAGPVWPALRAMLLSVAAGLYAQAGALDLARKAVEQACEADPSSPRAVATLAAIAGDSSDRVGVAAVERAMGIVVPRGAACHSLAQAFEALGEMPLALVWTQRWLTLRPGNTEGTAELLRRAVACGDASRIAEALGAVLAQPKPLADLAEAIASALDALIEIDRFKARSLARRALDMLGPRIPLLRERLLKLAQRASDSSLAIAVLERYAAAEEPGEHTFELLFDLADRRMDAGDFDGAAREISRAAEGGVDAATALAHLGVLEAALREMGASLGSDGLIAAAEARTLALLAMAEADGPIPEPSKPESSRERGNGKQARSPAGGDGVRGEAARALRDLGSLRWDLAEDPRGAEEAFFHASEVSPRGGVERYAQDLFAFAGAEDAIASLAARANVAHDEGALTTRANLLIEAANLANEQGLPEHALVAAASAIESDPSRADAVALVEKNAGVEGGLPILDHTYDLLAAAAMGCYGRRAAHYRAARQLERRGGVDLALRHAAACFEAVPSEGTSYVLLARLAERVGDATEAVRALVRVAERGSPDARATWLVRAAGLSGKGEEGARTRLDLLLQALNLRPDTTTVGLVGMALQEVLDLVPDDDMTRIRFENAVKASLARLDGPDGSRAAVAMAKIAVQLADNALAFTALTRAMNVDGDIDEYAGLMDAVPALIGDARSEDELALAVSWLESVRAAADKPYSSVGGSLLRLASRLAKGLGDERTAATILVQAVRRAPDDDALVDEADVAVSALGDASLTRALEEALPEARRSEALLHLAEKHERDGQPDLAIAALERALASGELRAEAAERASRKLRALFSAAGRIEDAEAMLQVTLEQPELATGDRAEAARDLAESLARRGELDEAVDTLAEAAQRGAATPELLTDLRALVRSTGDPRRHADVLTQILDLLPGDASRLAVLRELAPLLQELGDKEAAFSHYEAISHLDPADAEALEVLEREANERGDHETIAALLARRIAGSPQGDRRRMLHLRRAAVLEQRLGKLDDAAAELTALLEDSPDDVSALRFLADIRDRLGDKRAAGALLQKLGELAPTSDERADYGLRAAASFLAGDDLDTAEQILESVAPIAEREAVLEIRVDLARRRGDARALSEELDRLAACSREPADRRAAILLDAARAASAINDEAAALDRARRAAKLAPGMPEAVLEARRFEYRAGGAGTPREAQGAVDDLNRIAPRLRPENVELHAFLLAEELDVIQGGGAGMRELSRRHAEVGPLPLIALGMAERLVRLKNFEAALPLFEQALAGDLRGMRSRGRVGLSAAEAAVAAAEPDAAVRILNAAALEPDTSVLAQRKLLELTAIRGEPAEAKKALEELIRQTTGVDRARAMAQLGRLIAPTDPEAAVRIFSDAVPLATGDKTLSTQIAEALAKLVPPSIRPPREAPSPRPSPVPAPTAAAEPAAAAVPAPAPAQAPISNRTPPVSVSRRPNVHPPPVRVGGVHPPPVRRIASVPPPPAARPASIPPLPMPVVSTEAALDPSSGATRPSRPPPAIRAVLSPINTNKPRPADASPLPLPPPAKIPVIEDEPSVAPLSLSPDSESLAIAPPHDHLRAEIRPPPPPAREPAAPSAPLTTSDEGELQRELSNGSFEAGERLIELYGAKGGERAHDVLLVRRQQASIRLGDAGALRKLHEAAVLDADATYARAIEYVLSLIDPTVPPPPIPPLSTQRHAPDLVNQILFRPIAESAVHEALAIVLETGLYRRDMAQYHLTGVARVQPGAGTVLGDAFGTVSRFLGQSRTALFHLRATTPPAAKIALLSPPAIILTGDIRDETPELRYLLGASLTGAMAEHALVNALNEEAVRTVIDALLAAFGPVANLPRGNAAVARLGQNLWQLVGQRAERRLRELCAKPDMIAYEAAVSGTRQAMRRAGLFAVGGLATALRLVAFEQGTTLPKVPQPAEPGVAPRELLLAPDGLAQLCQKNAVLADLFRLAIGTEFAEARWLNGASQERRRP